jgi:hypothetical protein
MASAELTYRVDEGVQGVDEVAYQSTRKEKFQRLQEHKAILADSCQVIIMNKYHIAWHLFLMTISMC